MAQVKWLKKALKSLDEAAIYIAEDNPIATRKFVAHVFEGVDQLVNHPAIGRAGRVPGTRELVFPVILILCPIE